MPNHRYFLTDFVTIQRQSFFELLEKGLIEEFSKRNPITNTKRDLEFLFYPEYYILTRPEYTPQEAIIKNKSYTSKLFVPGQLTDLKSQKTILKWFYIGNIPIMTKRGHFILNGAARVIVNQIIRSPGIYYQQKIYENYEEKWSQKPDDAYKRFYADLICMRGTWLRIEIDKEKNIWAQMKKGPKIPMYWFLLAMGLSEKKIFKSILDSFRLLGNLKDSTSYLKNQFDFKTKKLDSINIDDKTSNKSTKNKKDSEKTTNQNKKYAYLKSPPEAWIEIYKLLSVNTIRKKKELTNDSNINKSLPTDNVDKTVSEFQESFLTKKQLTIHSKTTQKALSGLTNSSNRNMNKKITNSNSLQKKNMFSVSSFDSKTYLAEEGRKWLYNKFMNPRSYNLGKQGRLAFNKKLGLNILSNQTTLTGLDVLYATDYLIKVEKGIYKIDDIDHLKNRRVRTSGELIQIQVGIGLVRLEKLIRENLNKLNIYDDYDFSVKKPFGLLTVQQSNSGSTLVQRHQKTSLSSTSSTVGTVSGIGTGIGKTDSVPTVGTNSNLVNVTSEGISNISNTSLSTISTEQTGMVSTVETPTVNTLPFNRSLQIQKGINSPFYSPFDLPSIPTVGNVDMVPLPSASRSFTFGKEQKNKGKSNTNKSLSTGSKLSVENQKDLILNNFLNSKAFNSAIREFFGTSPLSQFMDQINPLAELTHKRRLSSMGPGGVTRDTATLAIRGIHPTHYGRICPIETPEGKNTGLVNSMTTYARVNLNGIIESPFYKVYKGQVQKNTGIYYFSAEQEEQIKLAAADLSTTAIGFLPKSLIPVRIAEDFTKIPRSQVQFVGISPLQMISVATSLIPFLEHDDANRALMGSNMQRQAVPLIKPERPIVGTGLEARTISDSGHVMIAKSSGFVTYVSSNKIIVHSLSF